MKMKKHPPQMESKKVKSGNLLFSVLIAFSLLWINLAPVEAASIATEPSNSKSTVLDASGAGAVVSVGQSMVQADSTGYALSFGTSNSYVNLSNPAKLHLSQFTLETWFRRDGLGVYTTTGATGFGISQAIPLVTRGHFLAKTSTNSINYFLGIDSKQNVLAADFQDSSTFASHPVYGKTFITPGVWHHAAATYNGASWNLYLDGTLDATLSVNMAANAASNQYAAIGSALGTTGTADGFFNGVMDETRIWNRALTQADLRTGMNQALTTGTGLVGRWGMNEGTGTAVADSTTSPANGTVKSTGFTWDTNAPFNINFPPDLPSLVTPGNGSARIVRR
jgi:hypothetical protein